MSLRYWSVPLVFFSILGFGMLWDFLDGAANPPWYVLEDVCDE